MFESGDEHAQCNLPGSRALEELRRLDRAGDRNGAHAGDGPRDSGEYLQREFWLKRPFDVALATVALLVSAPFWLICALAIWLEDGGRVFHVQERWGKGKKRITVWKFRTMIDGADSWGGSVQARPDDPRVTRFGRWLRATSLDELPQILSIWWGDMSWVGPRALPINEVQVNEAAPVPDQAIPGFDLRCRVRPGLTGVAQIYAPRDIRRREKFRYDRIYIRRQSLWLDLRLIALSFWITLRGRWEYRGRKF